jgi:DnaJ-class molecular chaperone
VYNLFIFVVLLDPEQRAIYDTLGAEALHEAQQSGQNNMELMVRYRTPIEIREEFERLQRYENVLSILTRKD